MAAAVVMGSLNICSHCEKNQVESNDNTATLVALSQESEEHLHLVAGLLDVADVIEDQYFVGIQTA